MPRALCHVFQAIPEQFLECGRVHCPASGGMLPCGVYLVCSSVWVVDLDG